MKHSEPDPAAGQRHREWLWEFASARGVSRRQFLRLMMGGHLGSHRRLRWHTSTRRIASAGRHTR